MKATITTEPLLTVREAADLLGVTTTTLRNWDRDGRLRAARHPINRYRLYRAREVRALLQKLRANELPGQQILFREPNLYPSAGIPVTDIGTPELKRILRSMSAAFRDSEGASIVERFEEISKLLFCKFLDEIEPSSKSPFSLESDLLEEEQHRRVVAIYERAKKRYPSLAAYNSLEITKDVKAVARCAMLLSRISLSSVSADVKGVAYEELVKDTFDKTENQQYFTPRPIVDFMVGLVDPKEGELVCDPACGSGGFLVGVLKHIGVEKKHSVRLIGVEIDKRMAWIAQLNLFLHGVGESCISYFPNGGSLSFGNESTGLLKDGSVDAVITNPPFGSDYSEPNQLAHYVLGRSRQSRRRGVLFIERCIRLVRERGRIAMIIDDGVLNGPNNEDTRRLVLDQCNLEAVFSLPDVAFMPYATAKASILFLVKRARKGGKTKPVFMADIQHVGRRPNGDPEFSDERDEHNRPKLLNEMPTTLEVWKRYKERPKEFASTEKTFVVTPEHIEETAKHDCRFDLLYCHPARAEAERLLARSAYLTAKLGELIVERNETIVPSVDAPDDIIRYIGLANIGVGNGEYFVSEVRGEKLKSAVRLFRAGDILFSKLRPELRKVVLVAPDDEEGYVSAECFVFRVRAESDPDFDPNLGASPHYLAYMLRSNLVFGQLVFQVTGVGRPRLSKSGILNVRIPLPPFTEQLQLVRVVERAQRNYLQHRERSITAMREAEETLRGAYDLTISRLCPA